MEEPREHEHTEEFRHWGRVYAAVLVSTAITIVALWLFSRAFTPSQPTW